MTSQTRSVVHTMMFHLVMIAWMAPTVGAYCSNPLPGSLYLMQGVDLLTFDINEMNFKKPVIDATCIQGLTKHLGDSVYDLPDQVSNWYRINRGSLTGDSRIIKTMSDVTNKLHVGVTVEGSYGAVSASASVKYNEMQRNIVEKKYFYSILESETKTGGMNLNMQPTLSKDATSFLSSIEKPFNEAPEPYLRFIETFGTHYFSSGFFGGVIRAEFKIKSSLFKKYNDEDLAVQTKIAYDGLVGSASVSSEVKTETKTVTTDFKKSSSSEIQYYGGNDNVKKNGIDEWQPTVLNHPTLISGKLSPISNLLKDKPEVQEQLELAVESYYVTQELLLQQELRLAQEEQKKQEQANEVCVDITVTTLTSNIKHADTDDPVYISIPGVPEFLMDNKKCNDRERGEEDIYKLGKHCNVDLDKGIQLRIRGDDGWHADKIVITEHRPDFHFNEFTFPVDKWLDDNDTIKLFASEINGRKT